MSEDGMDIRGGESGLAADLEAMRSAAHLLDGVSGDLTGTALAVGCLAADAGLSRTVLLDPIGVAAAEQELISSLAGPDGLVPCAVRLQGLAAGISAAAALYGETERATAQLLEGLADGVAEAAGAATSTAVTSGLPLTTVAVADGFIVWAAWRAAPPVWDEVQLTGADIAAGRFRFDSLDDRYRRVGERQHLGMRDDVLNGRDDVLTWLAAHPRVAEQLVTSTPAFLDGLTGPLVVPRRLPVNGSTPSGGSRNGVVWPPEDPSELAALLSALGASAHLLVDGRVEVRPVRSSRSDSPSPAATGVTGALQRLAPYASADPAQQSRIRVERIQRGAATSWSVYIPPTQTWRFDGGANPFDGSSNVRSVGGQSTAAASAVTQALAASGARRGEPVMLSGYSQGGLTAAQLAADPDFRKEFSVSTVLTVGSPVAGFDVPDDVQVLSIEHEQDLVPALDDGRNPDARNWTTVRRDLEAPDALGQQLAAELERNAFAGHGLEHYVDTAELVNGSRDRSVTAWQRAAAPFLDTAGAEVEVMEWKARRVEE
jgi:hypothetical protein